MAWPPTVEELRDEIRGRQIHGESAAVDPADASLGRRLDAAVDFTERTHGGDFNFAGDPASPLPDPDAGLVLGTLMLAARWRWRMRSPDAMIDSGDMGVTRVAGYDPDIDRLLRLGKHQKPRVG